MIGSYRSLGYAVGVQRWRKLIGASVGRFSRWCWVSEGTQGTGRLLLWPALRVMFLDPRYWCLVPSNVLRVTASPWTVWLSAAIKQQRSNYLASAKPRVVLCLSTRRVHFLRIHTCFTFTSASVSVYCSCPFFNGTEMPKMDVTLATELEMFVLFFGPFLRAVKVSLV